MVEPMRTVLDRNEDAGSNYKPVAALAVAAFGVSVVFGGLVLVLSVVGLAARKPVLEPWLIVLAFSGVLLAAAARWQIALSEGTREGRRLSNVAWWLSLVGGAVYTAFYFGNVYAIQAQARDFVQENYLGKLRDGKVDEAYVSTISPEKRRGMKLSEIKQRFGDPTGGFRIEQLPRLMERAGGKVEFRLVGVAERKHTQDGLEIATHYVIRTPEGDFDAMVAAVGVDERESGAREWFVRRNTNVRASALSVYGHMTGELQKEADHFLNTWLYKRFPGFRYPMYLDTLPLTTEQRRRMAREYVLTTALLPGLADALGVPHGVHVPAKMALWYRAPDGPIDALHPEAKEMNRELVVWDESKQKRTPEEKEKMLPEILSGNHIGLHMGVASMGVSRTNLEVLADRVRVSVPLEVVLPVLDYRCTGRLYAECGDAAIVRELHARAELVDDPRPPPAKEAEAKDLLGKHPHEWRVTKVVIDLARDLNDERPGAGSASMPTMRSMPGPK